MVYLDAAATSGYRDADNLIIDTMVDAMKKHWQNPSSLYATNVKTEINRCRENIAKFIGAKSDEIYFTSGASESNSWAIRGWADYQLFPFKNIITTRIEHKSILNVVNISALRFSVQLQYCDVDEFGFIDCQCLEKMLMACGNEPILVSVSLANSEIGTIQDVKTISNLVHQYGGVLHIDATQAFAHIPINVDEMGIDMLSASGHKLSPVLKGIGFLYKKNCINILPLIYGSQESGLRGGTENTFGIIGLSKAVDYCNIDKQEIDEMCNKRNYFINLLESKFDCELNGDSYYRLPNNINVTFPQDITGESLLYILDTSDIKIATGSACNNIFVEPSHVLKAIGLSDEDAMRTVRFSLPNNVTYEEIDFVTKEIEKVIRLIEM